MLCWTAPVVDCFGAPELDALLYAVDTGWSDGTFTPSLSTLVETTDLCTPTPEIPPVGICYFYRVRSRDPAGNWDCGP
jgi:hypothetical protein